MSFNDTYWASKSPEIRAMFLLVQNNPQQWSAILDSTARGLAARGRTGPADLVDVPIMGWQWDPNYTMTLRKQDGYAWTPSALTPPVEIPPGIIVPGQPSYDPNNPPPLSIKVSTDPADYPAYQA